MMVSHNDVPHTTVILGVISYMLTSFCSTDCLTLHQTGPNIISISISIILPGTVCYKASFRSSSTCFWAFSSRKRLSISAPNRWYRTWIIFGCHTEQASADTDRTSMRGLKDTALHPPPDDCAYFVHNISTLVWFFIFSFTSSGTSISPNR